MPSLTTHTSARIIGPFPIASTRPRMESLIRRIAFIALGLLATTGAPNYAQQPPPSIQHVETEIIGSFPGPQSTIPTAINNRGQVVGGVSIDRVAGFDAFIWTRDSGIRILLPAAFATDINNRGDVVGRRYECTTFPDGGIGCDVLGFLWNAKTGFRNLGGFLPNAINDSGDMAGECAGGASAVACALRNGVLTRWACGQPDCGQAALGINARGNVVGEGFLEAEPRALLFPRRGDPIVLGAGTAEDINNAGVVAGSAPPHVGAAATVWTKQGVVQALSTVPGLARAINARGWTAGTRFGEGFHAAFFWDPKTGVVVFLDPDETGSEASDINDRGEIVGTRFALQQAVIWRIRP